MKTIDLNNKVNVNMICQLGSRGANYTKKNGQEFYYSPSKKHIHLVEKLPNGDYYIYKSFLTSKAYIQ